MANSEDPNDMNNDYRAKTSDHVNRDTRTERRSRSTMAAIIIIILFLVIIYLLSVPSNTPVPANAQALTIPGEHPVPTSPPTPVPTSPPTPPATTGGVSTP